MPSVEQDFRNALKEILAKMPAQNSNVTSLAEISFSKIARQARHSRTLISKEECAYPEMRALILRVQRRINSCRKRSAGLSDEGNRQELPAMSLVEANTRLRKRVKELSVEVQMFATLLAEADQQLRIYQKGDARGAHDRERKANRNKGRYPG
jgi:hypothetical protein